MKKETGEGFCDEMLRLSGGSNRKSKKIAYKKVKVSIDDAIFLRIAKDAQKRGITFDEMACKILKKKIDQDKKIYA
jgi:hypothetical protein